MNGDFPRNDFINQAKAEGHSKEFIQSTTEYAEKLENLGLPVLYSLKHLALTLDIPYIQIREIIRNRRKYYGLFKISKKVKGYREIRCPQNTLKDIQHWILYSILAKVRTHESCIGFKKGDSIKKNATIHLGQPAILKLDLYRFFDMVTEKQVYNVFKSLGYHPNLAVDLAKLCTVTETGEYVQKLYQDTCPTNFIYHDHPFLPQGAPSSPALANLVLYRLDVRLKGLADFLGVQYTRYADDITFSGEDDRLPKISLIDKIVRDEGFYLNHSKILLRKKGQQQKVTGLIVSGTSLRVPRKYKRDIWKHLLFLKKRGVKEHLEYIKNKSGSNKSAYRDWLLGKIMFVKSIEPTVGNKMLFEFNQIKWPFYD
ncbi:MULTISPECIES: reverse transcriptase family protein [Bacillus cereus group]|uniref:reverse transcriptase family protein n=1 Tax=Bacillus cereus group TaxID=86661 RepID=UPI001F55C8CE|nr:MULTISPECIES: reverse transcriptase family protein [Bacillus cereus group]MDW3038324.1 reverse transcriptase family protein [Bacillus pacificus]